ncbi:hypothetical protein A2U01_0067953 [Trifolium medium]|uniref:Uncharacterized protein n=1 Tax=Trifolium medium TaxID=97028 RepID=A0A392SE47_9FABA|nr:hypothetical protein [Trifolium medium]
MIDPFLLSGRLTLVFALAPASQKRKRGVRPVMGLFGIVSVEFLVSTVLFIPVAWLLFPWFRP